MEKEYIKPDIVEILIEPTQLLSSSMPGFGDGFADDSDALGKEHFGSKFDVWDDWGASEDEY